MAAAVAGGRPGVVGCVAVAGGRAGDCGGLRGIYMAGCRWSSDWRAVFGNDMFQLADGGFLAKGPIHLQYADCCVMEFVAPQAVAIEPGHDGWVVGDEAAVMIEFDFESDTVRRTGMAGEHRH